MPIKYILFILFMTDMAYAKESFPLKFSLKNLFSDKVYHSQKDFPDEFIILDFWASWCEACKKNLFTLEKINKEVEIIPVSVDENILEAKNFFKLNDHEKKLSRMRKNAVFDEKQFFLDKYLNAGVPFLVILSPEKKVVYEHAGEIKSGDLKKMMELMK